MWKLFEIQDDIYKLVARVISQASMGESWTLVWSLLPMGVLFGAIHALTPGHSKLVLASYVVGSPAGIARGLLVSLTLSATHIAMAVLIAVFSLPLISGAIGSIGRAPALEHISRYLLATIGLWMIWRAFHAGKAHYAHEGKAFGLIAGLIPCPLTLFVMTLAISRHVPHVGLVFAFAMFFGVMFTLSLVVLATATLRTQILHILENRPGVMQSISSVIEGLAGALLLGIAAYELAR